MGTVAQRCFVAGHVLQTGILNSMQTLSTLSKHGDCASLGAWVVNYHATAGRREKCSSYAAFSERRPYVV